MYSIDEIIIKMILYLIFLKKVEPEINTFYQFFMYVKGGAPM